MNQRSGVYPRIVKVGDHSVELQVMTGDDREAILEFARALPQHDLLFLRRDIRKEPAVDAWLADIERGLVRTVLARIEGRLAGYGTLHGSELGWFEHVGELRILVAEDRRGLGLGRLLTQEVFSIALEAGIEKMVARMTLDQEGAIATFEGLGFKAEALLRDHVKDLEGNSHDLLMMCHAVGEFHQTLVAYGVEESLGS